MANRKIKWNGRTLDVFSKGTSVSVTFTDSDNSIVGQYEFIDTMAFNESYITNAVLRNLVGDDNGKFHSFKLVTGLFVVGYTSADTVRIVDELLCVNTKINCTNEIGKISKLLNMLHTGGAMELATFLIREKARFATNVIGYYNYYSEELIGKVLALLEHDDSKNTPVEQIMLNRLRAGAVPGYNWRNYEELSKFGLQYLTSAYDDKYRGNIEKIHMIDSGNYVIIETLKDGVKQYYSANRRQSHNMFYAFDECLLFAMCEPHFDSVIVLYNHGRGIIKNRCDVESTDSIKD